MQINKINPFIYYHPAKIKSNTSFLGGYKDLKNEEDRRIFDRTLELCKELNTSHNASNLVKEKTIYLGGEKLTLCLYNNSFYVLKSQDGDIKATMKILEHRGKTCDCENEFYSNNNGVVKISLLLSKGNGAGSLMLKEAVNRSFEKGYEGRVILSAEVISYIIGSPIPFYYKAGLKAFDSEVQKCIEKKMQEYNKTGIYEQDQDIQMYLDPERIQEYLDK